ncbi:MAG: BolA family transcriptional regulator [Bordetella sp.]|nr:MAG: BolA family transcriptional regulator [Bordetella sp.]
MNNNLKNIKIPSVIRIRLLELQPTYLKIEDESHLHIHHEAGKKGARHFHVDIVSGIFSGMKMVRQHQLVYDCLKDLIPFPIHALAIRTKSE